MDLIEGLPDPIGHYQFAAGSKKGF